MQDLSNQKLLAAKPESGASAHGHAGLLFLREEEFRIAQDTLYFAMRDLNDAPNLILAELGLGHAHHRCLHWVSRRPDLNVGELIEILAVSKQSLARVLGPLINQGYVAHAKGEKDRRQRLLKLTEKGIVLERKLFEAQRERLAAAYREAGGQAVDGFRRVMRGMTKDQGRRYLDEMESHRAGKAPPRTGVNISP